MQVILFTDVADTIGYGKYAGTYKIATEIRAAGYSCQVVDLLLVKKQSNRKAKSKSSLLVVENLDYVVLLLSFHLYFLVILKLPLTFSRLAKESI